MNRLVFISLVLILNSCTNDNLLQVKEGFTISNGSDLYYKIIGSGEPLIVIHGGPVLDHSYLLPHLEELAEDYQLIFYDQRACGKSSVEVDSTSMNIDGFVADIEHLRQTLNLNKINILGHSWGGMLAMNYAIKHPENLMSLILSNTMPPSSKDWYQENLKVLELSTNEDRKKLDVLASSGMLRSPNPAPYIKQMLKLSYKGQFYDSTKLKRLALNVPNDYMIRSGLFSLLGPDLQSFDLYKELRSLTVPTLLIYGEIEPGSRLTGTKLKNELPNAELVVLAGAGHFPFVERPTAFNNSVTSFLDNFN